MGTVLLLYYSDDWLANSAKEAFEKPAFTKTPKTNACTVAEIAMFENLIVVHKFVQDHHFFVSGDENGNKLILAMVLQGFSESLITLLTKSLYTLRSYCWEIILTFVNYVDKKEALENLDLIFLCLDDIAAGSIILETDANVIAGKVACHGIDAGAALSEQTNK